jgi:hypothetical protein
MPAAEFGAWLLAWSQHPLPTEPGLLPRIAEMLVTLDTDLLLAARNPELIPGLSISQPKEECPICQWLMQSGLPMDSPIIAAHLELHAMFNDWLDAGPGADSGMIQSALDHFLRTAGDQLRLAKA